MIDINPEITEAINNNFWDLYEDESMDTWCTTLENYIKLRDGGKMMSKDLIKLINRSKVVTRSYYGDKVTVYEKDLDNFENDFVAAIEALRIILKEMEPYHNRGLEDKGLFTSGLKIIEKAHGKKWETLNEQYRGQRARNK
jgi:hypothetical protein